jgi:hypothetical protein
VGSGAGAGEGDGEWDDESSGECSSSDDEGMCGFSGRDCQELLCQGVKPGRSRIDVMIFARLIFINLHVLMCEGILGVLDDVSAGEYPCLCRACAFSGLCVILHEVDKRKRTRVYACMPMIALFFSPF